MSASHPAIGGYFGLERFQGRSLDIFRSAARFASARQALVALLRAVRPARVWAPHFSCGAVNDALHHAEVKIERYALTQTFGVPDIDLAEGDVLFCVDYFGLCAHECDAAIQRIGAWRVIVDASQALFHPPQSGSHTIYSPRKFAGLPDGGVVVTALPLSAIHPADEEASLARSAHLLSRKAGSVALGYRQFQAAERSLSDCEPSAMSQLSSAMLRDIDFPLLATQRRSNYKALAADLRRFDIETLHLPDFAVPLCCPVGALHAHSVRRRLAQQGVYTPTYWPDAQIPINDAVALRLRDKTVYLPCDQRYSENDMAEVAQSFERCRHSS